MANSIRIAERTTAKRIDDAKAKVPQRDINEQVIQMSCSSRPMASPPRRRGSCQTEDMNTCICLALLSNAENEATEPPPSYSVHTSISMQTVRAAHYSNGTSSSKHKEPLACSQKRARMHMTLHAGNSKHACNRQPPALVC